MHEYNFLINNCSDYTDAILDVARIKGNYSQKFVKGDSPISVPVIREMEASLWDGVDQVIEGKEKISDNVGEIIEKSVGTIVEHVSDNIETVADHIEEASRGFLDWITFWD